MNSLFHPFSNRSHSSLSGAFTSILQAMTVATGVCLTGMSAATAQSAEHRVHGYRFSIPDGMTIERVAGPPLVNRPICADFDHRGRLYVADSSGSNENVKVQLEKRPHRIVRLEDSDGDGRFDKQTVFADRTMFPEGALWHDGSLYVGAPPQIWKLTDTDDDGRADKREVWFDGKTLTHCGNDMHGPYIGPDGWFYWCKGAFAEQTYGRRNKDPLVTRAAHIFRRHPSGGEIESVMAGGMDNPVEVVFTPGGERIFTTTFLVHPAHGQRDGIIHAIYGGVYGKVHHVLDGHARTGPIMPVLAHHGGASAPCGLVRLETGQLGAAFQDNVLACSFNMHKLIRHVLQTDKATFTTKDSDFLVCDSLDFHPTDVLEDADGSLLVVDTGGWYKMCCPTSQLPKPDILGGIYRVRRTGSHREADPRGIDMPWSSIGTDKLVSLLADTRFVVRNRARRTLGELGEPAVNSLSQVLRTSLSATQRLHAVWTLARIDGPAARQAVRAALADRDENVRQAALHCISVRRDRGAEAGLSKMLTSPSASNRRAAAEALGRVGSAKAVNPLLAAAAKCRDRVLQHSLTYALIEINDVEVVRAACRDKRPYARRAALIALDQMPGGDLQFSDIQTILASSDTVLRDTAWWIADQHPEFAESLSGYFRRQLRKRLQGKQLRDLTQRLSRNSHAVSVQKVMAEALTDDRIDSAAHSAIMEAMRRSGLRGLPAVWLRPLRDQLASADVQRLEEAVATVHALAGAAGKNAPVADLSAIAANKRLSARIRLQALQAIPARSRKLEPVGMAFLIDGFDVEQPVDVRALCVDVLTSTTMGQESRARVAAAAGSAGPMELRRLVQWLAKSKDPAVGLALVDSLGRSASATSLSLDLLQRQLAGFGEPVMRRAQPLLQRIRQANKEKIATLEEVLKLVEDGDIRRGQEVFHSSKASCIHCHGMGYLGGNIGPDLTRIGGIRSERDLLESILFPNASLVRSYEPVRIVTTKGVVLNGLIREETVAEVHLQLDAQKSIRLARREIEQRQAGRVSIMPAGLEKLFTPQQLADLIVFLKASK